MEKAQHSPLCKANGCPVIGTMSESTTGGDWFYCRYHFRQDAKEWQRITTRIRKAFSRLRDYDFNRRLTPNAPELERQQQRLAQWIITGKDQGASTTTNGGGEGCENETDQRGERTYFNRKR